MNISKLRTSFIAALASSSLLAGPSTVAAQEYPNKQINFVVASSAGGILDTVGRIVARHLEKLGQPVVVQNIPGAGSTLGTAAVARSAPDGYTVGMVATSHAINPSVYSRLPYDTKRDLIPISHSVNLVNVLVVHPSVPAENLKEFITVAKQKPGELNCGSAGNGQSNHLSLEMLKTAAGIDLKHIPYKGSALALNDVVGGFANCMFVDALSATQYVKTGKLRALAVSSASRIPGLPDVPTFAESGMPAFNANSWLGVVVRAGTPKNAIHKISAAAQEAMKDPEARERLISVGVEPVGSTPEQFERFLDAEMARYAAAVKAAGVKLD
jgi:tripartite-type tricarboxylate transporter receptor subunit TctC